jgi:hypothetical protein
MFHHSTLFRLFALFRVQSGAADPVEPTGLWLLITGTWADAGQWDDADTWRDS